MAWKFRKSKKFGLFRVNLSNSGISVSVGVKGARISKSSKGTHLNLSAGGFQNRINLSPKNTPPKERSAPSAPRTAAPPVPKQRVSPRPTPSARPTPPDIQNTAPAPRTRTTSLPRSNSLDLSNDAVIAQIVEMLADQKTISTALIQRRFSCGYTTAARLIDKLRAIGFAQWIEGNLKEYAFTVDEILFESHFGRKPFVSAAPDSAF